MKESLRIAVADDEPDMREYFQKSLPRLGHQVVALAENGCELVAQCRALAPDLVITDIKMPDMDGIDAASQIYNERPVPIILVSACHDADLIARAEVDHALAYLVKPIKQADLEPAIARAQRRFLQFEALRSEAGDLCQARIDRKIIERAKGVLMKQAGFDEQEAFCRLQELAGKDGGRLIDIAQRILVESAASS